MLTIRITVSLKNIFNNFGKFLICFEFIKIKSAPLEVLSNHHTSIYVNKDIRKCWTGSYIKQRHSQDLNFHLYSCENNCEI